MVDDCSLTGQVFDEQIANLAACQWSWDELGEASEGGRILPAGTSWGGVGVMYATAFADIRSLPFVEIILHGLD